MKSKYELTRYSYIGSDVIPPSSYSQLHRMLTSILPPLLPSDSILFDYYDEDLHSFNVNGKNQRGENGTQQPRLSITSTCFSILALQTQAPHCHKKIIKNSYSSVLLADWRETDLFQAPLVLKTILKGLRDQNETTKFLSRCPESVKQKIPRLIISLIESRPRRRDGKKQKLSCYISYQITAALALLHEEFDTFPPDLLPPDVLEELELALVRSSEVAHDALCRQLAFSAANDYTSYDPTKLIYSLLAYVVTSPQKMRKLPQLPVLNMHIVRLAVTNYFSTQKSNGYFPRGQAIYKTIKGRRDIQNSFVFSPDTVTEAVNVLPLSCLVLVVPQLNAMVDGLVIDFVQGSTRGWASNHFPPNSPPTAWSTAQVTIFLASYRDLVKKLLNNSVLSTLSSVYPMPPILPQHERSFKFDSLLDSDLVGGSTTATSLKPLLKSKLIEPHLANSPNAPYSIILHGPPGTAKTTVVEAVANYLGYNLLTITTSTFLTNGIENSISRIVEVFDQLEDLQNTVVLFDEIEEFCLDRSVSDNPSSRMLTTTMLTVINNLRKKSNVIFFFVTNRIRAVDAAVKRAGRFDMMVFVGTPALNGRIEMLERGLAKSIFEEKQIKGKEVISAAVRESYEAGWTTSSFRYLTYLESMKIVDTIIQFVVDELNFNGALFTTSMASEIILEQTNKMTVRDDVREEFNATEGIGRW